MLRVLIGSPVRQDPPVLRVFLESLSRLRVQNVRLAFCFVDDNAVPESSLLLEDFSSRYREVVVLRGSSSVDADYARGQVTHHWSDAAIWRVAQLKNTILEFAKERGYDFVFLVDSDLVLHPRTLGSLLDASKDIISEVFWTRWKPNAPELPQVWVSGQYDLFERDRGEQLSQQQLQARMQAYLSKLREPGVYRVGGLGACTLISRRALVAGVTFDEMYNVPLMGEDRHFSIRATALGFELWVDTHFPAYHVYRTEDLAGARRFLELTESEDELVEIASDVVRLYGLRGADTEIESKARALLEPHLAHNIVEVYRAHLDRGQGVSFSEVSVSRVCVQSVDGRRGLARVVVWLTNRGREAGEYFCDDLIAHVELRHDSTKWLASAVQFIPLPRQVLVKRANDEYADRRGSVPTVWVLSSGKPKLVLAMTVRNEANRYLRMALEEARHYIDAAAIIDDASTDGTVDVCKEVLADIPAVLHVNQESWFHNEHILRKALWELAGSLHPEWILVLDADEVFELRARHELRPLLDANDVYYYAFRLYDFWDEEHYREDQWWRAHLIYRPFLVRFIPGFEYRWKETPQHCGRVPVNVTELRGRRSDLRIKHFGWAREEDRIRKYQRYLELDPESRHGIREQYLTILDPSARLVRWQE